MAAVEVDRYDDRGDAVVQQADQDTRCLVVRPAFVQQLSSAFAVVAALMDQIGAGVYGQDDDSVALPAECALYGHYLQQ